MTKFLTSLTMAGFVLGAATHLSAAPMVYNGDFQTGTFDGWGTPNGATIVADAGPAGVGDYAVRITTADWGTVISQAQQAIAGVVGETYVASVSVKVLDTTSGKQTSIGITRGWSGNYPGYTITQNDPAFASGEWTQISWQFTTVATSNGQNFAFTVGTGGGGGARDLYIDNISVAPIPEPTIVGLGAVVGLAALGRRRRTA